jgi:hypothetical protein
VAILMKFDVQPAPRVLQSMKREVAELLEPAGINISWRLAEGNEGTETFPHLVVVRFDGTCRNQPVSFGNLQPLLDNLELGSTAVRDGHALPFAEIHCDHVTSFLRPWKAAGQTVTLGAAIGRVVVHELYHVLTNTLTHGSGGLSKATISSVELGLHGAKLSAGEVELFRRSVQ